MFDSLTIKVLKYLLIYGFLFMFSIFGNVRNTNGSTIVVVLLLIMAIVYRFSILFERINLKNLTISFRKSNYFDIGYVELLVSDIELSLNKINSFANWSCGILATISIFVSTIYLNFLKDLIPREELTKLFVGEIASLRSSFIGFLGQLMLMIIFVLFVYYLTVQTFTYDRRFVIIVLKSSLYIDENDEIIYGFLNKWRYIKNNFIPGI